MAASVARMKQGPQEKRQRVPSKNPDLCCCMDDAKILGNIANRLSVHDLITLSKVSKGLRKKNKPI